MTEFFSALADNNDALIVLRPSQVVNGPGDRLVLGLQDVLFVDRIPDPDLAGLIGRGNVESARGILGDIDQVSTL
jgi:hypothetical protein